ncbi:zinc-dependent peptidase [bacterium]|nr:zinc-dependent peptidase [bacterium]
MRINPLKSLFVSPVRPGQVASKSLLPAGSEDQVKLSSSSGGVSSLAPAHKTSTTSRLLAMARGLSLGVALAVGAMGAAGVVSYIGSQQGGATDQLLSTSKNLSGQQKQLASAEMMAMGEKTLRWMGASGERIYITDNDDQVVQLYQQEGRLQALEPASILAQGLKVQSALEQAHKSPEWQGLQQRRDSLNGKADQLRQQWLGSSKPAPSPPGGVTGMAASLGMMGFSAGPPPPPELLEVSKQQLKLQLEMDQLRNQAMQKVGADTQVVRPGMGSIESILDAARAKTPEQRQEFLQLLKAVNGGAVERQQAEMLEKQHKAVQQMPPGPLREISEKLLRNPDQLLLGMESPILIPQFTYYQLQDGSARVRNDDPILSKVQALGLHFGGRGVVQVDSDQVGSKTHVINHELGHSIDDLLERQNPKFYKPWAAQVKEALSEARQRQQEGKPVASDYSLTNQAEYVAEGVEYYFENPEMLKVNDPKLFALTEQLLAQADEQGKLNLKESLSLLAGAGLLGLAFGLTRGRVRRPQVVQD